MLEPMPRVEPPPAQEQAPPARVPSLDAEVVELRFFETGWDGTRWDARVYANVFPRQTTRYVSWELRLVHPGPSERKAVTVDAIFYRPDGAVFAEHTREDSVDTGWTSSSTSYARGWRTPGNWRPGVYRVELSIDDQPVAAGEFEIVDHAIPQTGAFAALREGLEWADGGLGAASLEEKRGLLALAGLARIDEELASTAAGLPWVGDGPDQTGFQSLQALEVLARQDVELAKRLIGLPWMADGSTRDEWLALRAFTLLAAQDPHLAGVIADLPWVRDGITEDERETVVDLQAAAARRASLASALLSFSWLRDGLTQQERWAIGNLESLARTNPRLAERVARMRLLDGPITTDIRLFLWGLRNLSDTNPALAAGLADREWFSDGLNEDESKAVNNLGDIASRSPSAAAAIAAMPFLDTIEPADALAITALRRVAHLGEDAEERDGPSQEFQRIMAHPRIEDGITDDETRVIATMSCVARNNPSLVEPLLDSATVERRSITLPLSGAAGLTIVRTSSGAGETMDLLETAVRRAEEFMGHPLPTREVVYLFEEATSEIGTGRFAGTNCESHIVSRQRYDTDRVSAEWRLAHFAHETAHYWWGTSFDWIREGGAQLVEVIALNAEYGRPLFPENEPCVPFQSIEALQDADLSQTDPGFGCNYPLGERLFHDLYRNMDETDFRVGFRRLYVLSLLDDPGDGCEGTDLGVCHVRAAFTAEVSPETAGTVERVIARWYDNSEPFDPGFRDDGPVVPEIPWVNGNVSRAWLSTISAGPSVSAIAGSGERLYLNLKYSYRSARGLDLLPLEITVYYEGDGFSFHHQKEGMSVAGAMAQVRGGSFRLSSLVTSGPPGVYWVYGYLYGQKIAEASYRIDPT